LDASGCKKIPIKEDESGDGNSSSEPATVPKPGLPNRAVGKRDVPAKDQKDPIFEDAEPADYDSKPTGKPLVAKPKVKPRPTGNLPPGVLFGKSSKFECEEQGLTSPPDTFMDRFTVAALADSTYEYLPKEYMLLGGQNEQYRTMYEKAMDTAREYLLFRPMLPDNNDVRFFAQVMASEATTNKSALNYRYEGSHLGCFTGGMLGIGAKIFGLEGDLSLAKKLTEGCVWAYGATTTGIMPETFTMLPCESMETCKWNETRYYDVIDPFAAIREQSLKALEAQLADSGTPRKDHVESPLSTLIPKLPEEGIPLITRDIDVPMPGELTLSKPPSGDEPEASGEFAPAKPLTHEQVAEKRIKEERIPRGMAELSSRLYILRPEAIESVFIMYRITGDEHWRQKGWQMFTSIERSTWTQLANSAIRDVTSEVPQYTDEMESFWLGETLKYFYLLFSEPSVVSLDEYVL
jgi:mannosyl-oligosaccharide alpha-1,2-mannosidase